MREFIEAIGYTVAIFLALLLYKSDNFLTGYPETQRRVVITHKPTNESLWIIEGLCTIKNSGTQLVVTCKTGPDTFNKLNFNSAEGITFSTERLNGDNVDTYRYCEVNLIEITEVSCKPKVFGKTKNTDEP